MHEYRIFIDRYLRFVNKEVFLMICRYFSLIVGIMVLALLIPTVVEACPSCKTIDDPIVQGFKWSILFLMAMPYIVSGLIGGSVFLRILPHTSGR